VASLVYDLDSGAQASLNADQPFPSASLFKLPILAESVRQDLDPDTRLEIRPEDWTDGSGVLQARVGERLSVAELQRLMIQDSDNIAALVLLDAVGIDNVNASLARLGLSGTHLVDHRHGESGEHVTTAADTARLLELMATGQLENPAASERALRLLELPQANAWLAEDLPWWLSPRLAHKWGDLPDARNDAGVVFSVRGSFVAVVLTAEMPPEMARGVIARTAKAAFGWLPSPSGLLHL
jgi:beta-lactamase class A